MIARNAKRKIITALKRSPAVALLGARQVGKTTLALEISGSRPSVYLDLENRLDLQKVRDIEAFHAANSDKLIILDEVQRLPQVFSALRGIIDKERRRGKKNGHFLFLGSTSLELLQQSGESLAGRIAYTELYPIDVLEFLAEDNKGAGQDLLWLRGGFPESLLAQTDEDSLAWRNDFIRTYLERDIPQLGPRIPAETLERFWRMLAHNQGNLLNAAHMARNIGVSGVTIARYLDLMVDLFLVRRLQPWTTNIGKRLIRTPKVYIRGSGVTHALLHIPRINDLLGHPVIGGSWEGFVIENILSVSSSHVRPYYYRTAGGAEVDLLLEFGANERWAIEIKRNSAPSVRKGFYTACEDVKASRKYVVYAGQDTFPMQNGIIASSLQGLMNEVKLHSSSVV